MTCDDLRDSCELYALGALEEPEWSELTRHLQENCGTCRKRLKRAIETTACLAAMVPLVEPPARLRKRVLAGVGIEPRNRFWQFAWAAAAACLLVAVFWLNARYRERTEEVAQLRREVMERTAEVQQAREAVDFLNEPETKQAVFGEGAPQPLRGRVLVNPNRGVLLLVSDLPPAPSGKIYEMWLIPKKGAPKPAGLFQANADGKALHIQRGPVDLAQTAVIAVTVEAASGSQAPTSKPILAAALAL